MQNEMPRQTDLRRAVSTAYYALFHTLATCCADCLVGSGGRGPSRTAWRHAYRALNHAPAAASCANPRIIEMFPAEIEDFANAFVVLQAKRHDADYDPYVHYTWSEVRLDIELAEETIRRFERADRESQRAFAAFVMLPDLR